MIEALRAALADRYRVERELGRGGMATVYLAPRTAARPHRRDQGAPDRPGRAAAAERFLAGDRGSRPGCRIRTSSRCTIRASADGLLYYVMPFVEGESLRERLERERRLPIADAMRIAREVAQRAGLRPPRRRRPSRHQAGEHPAARRASALVADFGIARALGERRGAGRPHRSRAWRIGTPAYMSPEQASADEEIGRAQRHLQPRLRALRDARGASRRSPDRARGRRCARHVVEPPPALRTLRRRGAGRGGAGAASGAGQGARTTASPPPATSPARSRRRRSRPAYSGVAPVPHRHARHRACCRSSMRARDPDNEYFTDGITDELIDALAKVPGLRMAVAHVGVFASRGSSPTSARSVRCWAWPWCSRAPCGSAGPRLRITAQLTDVRDGRHLWSQRFDRECRTSSRCRTRSPRRS